MRSRSEKALTNGIRVWRASTGFALSISRHSALSVNRLAVTTGVQKPRAKASLRHTLSLLAGSSLIGLGVALFVHANLGLTPYDVMLSVIRDRVGISLGQAAWASSAVLFAVAAALGRRPRLGGLIFVFVSGIAVDAAIGLVQDPELIAVRVAFVVLGALFLLSGISLVVHSGLTGGPFELLMQAGADRGFDPIRIRGSLEIGIFLAGLVLGGDFGIATVAYALSVGPVMRVIGQAMQDHRQGRATRLTVDTPSEILV